MHVERRGEPFPDDEIDTVGTLGFNPRNGDPSNPGSFRELVLRPATGFAKFANREANH